MTQSPDLTSFSEERWWQNRRNQLIGLAVVVVVLAVIAGVVIAKQRSSSATKTDSDTVTNESTKVPRRIDGVEVSEGKENLYPVAVMIENLSQVRPQAGLGEANVVYEALAEGGITRFMAIFAQPLDDIERLGPVRSAREYYVAWAEEYGAVYMHAGGSPGALSKLQNNNKVVDMNEIGAAAPYYFRDKQRQAPHNLFSKGELVSFLLRDKGLTNTPGAYTPWQFATGKATPTMGDAGATSVRIPFSGADYMVEYAYDAESKKYKRLNGGEEHTDALTDKQITVKNVLVQFTSVDATGDDKNRVDVDTTSGGKALAFINGKAIEGTWKYSSAARRTVFSDAAGEELVLEPGNVWVEVVPSDARVEYTELSAAAE